MALNAIATDHAFTFSAGQKLRVFQTFVKIEKKQQL
jgi:hypothetical protein